MTRLAAVKAERDAAARQRDFYLQALHLVTTTTPDHVETFPAGDDGSYAVKAYGLTRPHGGTVVISFCSPGQNDSISAVLFDDFCRDYQGASRAALPFARAAEHCKLTQYRLLTRDREAK